MIITLTESQTRALRLSGADNVLGHDAYLMHHKYTLDVPCDRHLIKSAIEALDLHCPEHEADKLRRALREAA